ncbi:AimR family lysis-lysogeny pheromone receptor [Bacillus thuringiensis]
MMKYFMNDLHMEIIQRKLDVGTLAENCKMDRTNLNRTLAGTIKEMKFDSFLLLIEEIYEHWEDKKVNIKKFMTLCEGDLNIKKILCHCQTIGDYETIEKVITKCLKNKKKKKIHRVLNLYSIYNKRNLKRINGQELKDTISNERFYQNAECQVVVEMLNGFAMYDMQNYRAMIPHSKQISKYLPNVKNTFIKENLSLQHEERRAFIKLMSNDVAGCREIAMEIIKKAPRMSVICAKALSCLAESYIIDNPLLAEEYFLESLKLIEEIGIAKHSLFYQSVHSTLAFLRIEYGFHLNMIKWEYVGGSERAFFEAKFGNKLLAKAYFDGLKENGKKLSAYKLYYLYHIEKNDIILLKESLEKFSENGNFFYGNIVTNHLLSRGSEIK